jgi:hypothetical protein
VNSPRLPSTRFGTTPSSRSIRSATRAALGRYDAQTLQNRMLTCFMAVASVARPHDASATTKLSQSRRWLNRRLCVSGRETRPGEESGDAGQTKGRVTPSPVYWEVHGPCGCFS